MISLTLGYIEAIDIRQSARSQDRTAPGEGCIWARAEKPVDLFVALESGNGGRVYAQARLPVTGSDWQRLDFTLTPNDTDEAGQFAITLKEPGSVALGYAFLQPGEWGRFKGLPVRRDVAEALIDEGITVLRYGGSMINDPEYRWKNMIGPRDRRPPYHGTWYPYSSNGWGILDFINFCRAAGFLAIPVFNMGESPRDMADFVEYVNGPADSEWGRRRAADGHPEPYRLRYLELGNEERVDEDYWRKFKPLAEAIWAKDSEMAIVVGDFIYGKPIDDPFKFTGAASGITSLAAQQKIPAALRPSEPNGGTDSPPARLATASCRTRLRSCGSSESARRALPADPTTRDSALIDCGRRIMLCIVPAVLFPRSTMGPQML